MNSTTTSPGALTPPRSPPSDRSLVRLAPPGSESEVQGHTSLVRIMPEPTGRIRDSTPVGGYGSHQQSDPEKPASTQSESSATITMHLGDGNEGCGIVQGSLNTAVTYHHVDPTSGVEHFWGGGSPQHKTPFTIHASAGRNNKDSLQFKNSGGVQITVNMSPIPEDGHQRKKRKSSATS
ncbi:hypothetical protein HOY80DRAFT_1133811 [Tuber brumale]|nr:hypothetical protein HOY80DRAFT_1133811 [Tuber brumale]